MENNKRVGDLMPEIKEAAPNFLSASNGERN